MGDWKNACDSADIVLNEDKNYVKAIMVKAEALYNNTDFEHALVLFHRGKVSSPVAHRSVLVTERPAKFFYFCEILYNYV